MMATKLENLPLDVAHFLNFSKHLPGAETFCQRTVAALLELGLIQVSTAFEHALATVGGHTVVSENRFDLSDGSDAKLSSVRHNGLGSIAYSAPVNSVSNKTGALRVQVYERKQNRFFYFVIPRRAYSHVKKTGNINIPFEMDGTPRRIPCRAVTRNWWNYEVSSFEELAVVTPKYTTAQCLDVTRARQLQETKQE